MSPRIAFPLDEPPRSADGPLAGKSFLFLQGGATPFFRALGRALDAAGHRVYRVNFCAGDELFWSGLPAWRFRDGLERLPAFLDEKIRGNGISDLVMFGDCRPSHRIAVDLARKLEIRVHVFEEGYLRPNWITVERDGVNGYSGLPREGSDYLELAADAPEFSASGEIAGGMLRRAGYDIAYHLANFLFARGFPGYRNHRSESAPMEYVGWIRRFSIWPLTCIFQRSLQRRILSRGFDYFLFPLQLSGDSQIQVHSRFDSMSEAIDFVLASFARSAPEGRHLLIKRHPLDTGTVCYRRDIRKTADRYGVADRVFFVEGGDLSAFIRKSLGVVTVNSTVGIAALLAGKPLFVIGAAVYKIRGLCFSGPLEQFWSSPVRPDPRLKDAFLKVCVHRTQIPGNYYSPEGIAAATAGAVARLAAEERGGDEALVIDTIRPGRAVATGQQREQGSYFQDESKFGRGERRNGGGG